VQAVEIPVFMVLWHVVPTFGAIFLSTENRKQPRHSFVPFEPGRDRQVRAGSPNEQDEGAAQTLRSFAVRIVDCPIPTPPNFLTARHDRPLQ
jgi:hypothetical protein